MKTNGRLTRYIWAATAAPFLTFLAIAMAGFVLEELFRLTNAIVVEKGPPAAIIRMMFYLTPEYLAQALLISFLLGVLTAFHRLNQENALASFYSSGVSLRRMATPVIQLAALLMAAMLIIAGVLQPIGAYEFEKTGYLVKHGAYGLPVKAGETMEFDDGLSMLVGAVDRKTGGLKRVLIEQCAKDKSCVTTTAERGLLKPTLTAGNYTLFLVNGRQIRLDAHKKVSGALNFAKLTYPAKLQSVSQFRQPGERAKETTLLGLWRAIRDNASSPQRSHRYGARLHAITIQSLAFFPFGVLGVVLGVAEGRRHIYAILTALLVFIGFVQGLNGAELEVGNSASPWLAMWPAFAIFVALSFALLHLISERSGALSRALNLGKFCAPHIRRLKQAMGMFNLAKVIRNICLAR